MRVRGLRDIKTSITLAREGRLVRSARTAENSSRDNRQGETSDSSDWNLRRHVYKKYKPNKVKKTGTAGSLPCQESVLAKEVRHSQIKTVQYLLEELNSALLEGIPVAVCEVKRLEKRLIELRSE